MTKAQIIAKGLLASGYGLAGVFIVLILFYILTKLLVGAFQNQIKRN
jgi:Na+-transporting methylmalonyl-CoA/oxaloacetate decarboxylase gamma subunit